MHSLIEPVNASPMPSPLRFRYVDPAAAEGDAQARDLLRPRRGTPQAAGLDLVAANLEPITLEPGARALCPTGIAIALEPGTEAQLRPRSGLALKHGVTLLNSPGTIDADYRGELKVLLINHGDAPFEVRRGMRVAQLVVASVVMCDVEPVSELQGTARGAQGFGSTGMGAGELSN